MRKNGILFVGFLALVVLFSCNRTFRSSRMYQAKKSYDYTALSDSANELEFRIEPNDIMDFRLFTNDGFKLIDLSTLNDANQRLNQQQANFFYLVEHDGNIKMPMIGRVNLAGMTIKEAESFLEEKYAKYYIDPFARVSITNRRVTVFSGEFSEGQVVEMQNRNLRLVEALAMSGGLSRSAKAHKIKIFRGDPKNPDVYIIDASRIEGYYASNFILQSNDIVYVEPRISLASEVLREWAPILTLITSVMTLYVLIISLQ